MKKKLISFKNARVLIVGDLILDRYWYNQNHSLLSEKSSPIISINQVQEQPGGAANVAKNITKIGGISKIIGFIGKDHEGVILQQIMNKEKIDFDLVALKKNKTITKIRVVSNKKQFIRLDFEEKYFSKNIELIHKKIINSILNFKVLILSDYAKGTLVKVQKIINLAKKMSIPILIDPKGIDFKKYSGASLLTPNLSEFEMIVGKCNEEKQIFQKGVELLSKLKLSALLVTRSKHGMTLFQPKTKPIHFPIISGTVYDVTGAGDTVIAIIAASLATGYSLEEACFYANNAASIVIRKIGTETLTIHELNNVLNIQ